MFSGSVKMVGKMRIRLSTLRANTPLNLSMPLQGERGFILSLKMFWRSMHGPLCGASAVMAVRFEDACRSAMTQSARVSSGGFKQSRQLSAPWTNARQ
jgi:hypothetical protein